MPETQRHTTDEGQGLWNTDLVLTFADLFVLFKGFAGVLLDAVVSEDADITHRCSDGALGHGLFQNTYKDQRLIA